MENNVGVTIVCYLFWLSTTVILFTYIIFPIILVIRAFFNKEVSNFKRTNLKGYEHVEDIYLPSLSILIAAYNEEDIIEKKIQNILNVDYPKELIEVLIASDGSTDRTNEIVANHPSKNVKLIALTRTGKNGAINQIASKANGDILVFTDADSMMDRSALRTLILPFSNPQVGGVAGSYHYKKVTVGAGGEGVYWKFDQKLRKIQSLGGNLISATGHLYAIRRELFIPVPPGVTDDAFISRNVISQNKLLVFEPRAVAYGPMADVEGEFRRKVRITSRGLRGVWKQRHLLNPIHYGFYAVQLFTLKVLRRLMFIPMSITLITAPFLWHLGRFFQFATLGQFLVHFMAVAGFILRDTVFGRLKVFSLPFFLDMTNLASALAIIEIMRGKTRDIWEAERVKSKIEEREWSA